MQSMCKRGGKSLYSHPYIIRELKSKVYTSFNSLKYLRFNSRQSNLPFSTKNIQNVDEWDQENKWTMGNISQYTFNDVFKHLELRNKELIKDKADNINSQVENKYDIDNMLEVLGIYMSPLSNILSKCQDIKDLINYVGKYRPSSASTLTKSTNYIYIYIYIRY